MFFTWDWKILCDSISILSVQNGSGSGQWHRDITNCEKEWNISKCIGFLILSITSQQSYTVWNKIIDNISMVSSGKNQSGWNHSMYELFPNLFFLVNSHIFFLKIWMLDKYRRYCSKFISIVIHVLYVNVSLLFYIRLEYYPVGVLILPVIHIHKQLES